LTYTYHTLKNLKLDPETNITTNIFNRQINAPNPDKSDEDIKLLLSDIHNKLSDDDLGLILII